MISRNAEQKPKPSVMYVLPFSEFENLYFVCQLRNVSIDSTKKWSGQMYIRPDHLEKWSGHGRTGRIGRAAPAGDPKIMLHMYLIGCLVFASSNLIACLNIRSTTRNDYYEKYYVVRNMYISCWFINIYSTQRLQESWILNLITVIVISKITCGRWVTNEMPYFSYYF